ncbi:hypothetical protein TNCV_2682141 [Trichonephila clavipes]|nr:hypothetical protein TNCV_2682141 [Trichonephila clavipes]
MSTSAVKGYPNESDLIDDLKGCLKDVTGGSKQLTDFDIFRPLEKQVGRIPRHPGRSDMVCWCWQQWITEGRVYRRGKGTQMIARIVQKEF